MKIILPVDPWHVTQGFGERPEVYKQFGLAGHNGWDIRVKYPDTPEGRRSLKAPENCRQHKTGDEGAKGYGKFTEFITEAGGRTFKHTYAHCHSTPKYTTKNQGEEIAISNNSGFSTAAHTHWTVKELNKDGTVKNYNNGYFGAINPQIYVDYIRSLPELPITPPTMNIPTELQTYSLKWKELCLKHGLDVNDKQFASYRSLDTQINKLISDAVDPLTEKVKQLELTVSATESKAKADLDKARIDYDKQLADYKAECQQETTILIEAHKKEIEALKKQIENPKPPVKPRTGTLKKLVDILDAAFGYKP